MNAILRHEPSTRRPGGCAPFPETGGGNGASRRALCQNRDMSGDLYFDGDPATDSARRHMERVLKGEPTPRWPWIVAALGSGGLWMLWRLGKGAAGGRLESAPTERKPDK